MPTALTLTHAAVTADTNCFRIEELVTISMSAPQGRPAANTSAPTRRDRTTVPVTLGMSWPTQSIATTSTNVAEAHTIVVSFAQTLPDHIRARVTLDFNWTSTRGHVQTSMSALLVQQIVTGSV